MTAIAAATVAEQAGKCVVTMTGEIDLAVADHVRAIALPIVESTFASGVVIDLSDVSFLDSTGVGTLVAIRNAALSRDLQVEVIGASARVRKLFVITGLDVAFGIA